MYHHGGGSYEEAASKAAKVARVKLDEFIQTRLATAEKAIEQVQGRVVTDTVVKDKALTVATAGDGWSLTGGTDFTRPLHEHAWKQVLADSGMDSRFADNVLGRGEWGHELVSHNINTLLGHSSGRHLVRTAAPGGKDDQHVMGFLSDRFRRLDSRPLLESFVTGARAVGLVPMEGFALDTKVRVRAVLPKVFEPRPDEVLVLGLQWGNSDFGNGGHELSLWIMRMVCTNLAIGEQVLRQIHLGKRLEDNIVYSAETYRLDTQANVSALKDTVAHAISPEKVNEYMEVIRAASAEEIKGRGDVVSILKKHLDKGTVERVADLFDGPDVTNLPAGNSTYRLSNALSWLAQTKGTSEDKRLDMQKLAGDLLPIERKGKKKAVEV